MSDKLNPISLFNGFKEGFLDFSKYSGFKPMYAKGADHLNCGFDGELKIELATHDTPETFLKACGGKESNEGFAFKVDGLSITVYPSADQDPIFRFDGLMTMWYQNDVNEEKAERAGQKMADALTSLIDMLRFYSEKRRAM